MSWLRHVDRWYSPFRADSYVARLDAGTVRPADCPEEVRDVMRLAREAEVRTDGYFTVRRPDGWGGRARLDPSGLVKGWAVERAAAVLERLEGTDYCLGAGGDLVCRTREPSGPHWRVGVEDPLDPARVLAVVPVRNGAVATSGSAHRGAHVVDPHTGRPPQGVASVTVVGPSLTWADVDATAAYARGRSAAGWLRARGDATGLVVWSDGRRAIVRPRPVDTLRRGPGAPSGRG